jgi:hypothetical protein
MGQWPRSSVPEWPNRGSIPRTPARRHEAGGGWGECGILLRSPPPPRARLRERSINRLSLLAAARPAPGEISRPSAFAAAGTAEGGTELRSLGWPARRLKGGGGRLRWCRRFRAVATIWISDFLVSKAA